MKYLLVFLYITVILASILISVLTGYAEDSGFKFLKIGPSARAQALADIYSARTEDCYALYYNPAGLAQQVNRQIYISDVEWLADLRMLNISYGQMLFSGGMGCSLTYFGMPTIDHFDTDGTLTGTELNKTDLAVNLGYAHSLFVKDFYAGIGIKYINSSLGDKTGSVMCSDIGLKYYLNFLKIWNTSKQKNFCIAGVIKNTGINFASFENTDSLPMAGILGFSYLFFNKSHHTLELALEGRNYFPSELIPAGSLEYGYREKIFFRTGYVFNNDRQTFTLGIGGQHSFRSSIQLNFDMAYMPTAYDQNLFSLSLGLVLRTQAEQTKLYDQIIKEKKDQIGIKTGSK